MSAIIISPLGILALPVTLSEDHVSALGMTENPVETGASMTDHAFLKPKMLTLEIAQAVPQISWQALKRIQADRRPVTVVTGLDVYRSMMLKDMSIQRTSSNGLILEGSIQMQEVVFATSARFAVEETAGTSSQAAGGASGTQTSGGGATSPSPEKAAPDTATQARTAGTAYRGDTPTVDVPTEGDSPEAQKYQSWAARILG